MTLDIKSLRTGDKITLEFEVIHVGSYGFYYNGNTAGLEEAQYIDTKNGDFKVIEVKKAEIKVGDNVWHLNRNTGKLNGLVLTVHAIINTSEKHGPYAVVGYKTDRPSCVDVKDLVRV